MIMIVEIVGTGTIVGTTVLTSWMISGATCSVIWRVISISKLRYAQMLKAGAVDAVKDEAITTGVEITAIMEISAIMEIIATMEDVIDPMDSTGHTGIRASMAHHHRVQLMVLHPDSMASRHNNVHRLRQPPARHRLIEHRHPGQPLSGPPRTEHQAQGHLQHLKHLHREHPRKLNQPRNSPRGPQKHPHKRGLRPLTINKLYHRPATVGFFLPAELTTFGLFRKY
jgi:hypothetical protein